MLMRVKMHYKLTKFINNRENEFRFRDKKKKKKRDENETRFRTELGQACDRVRLEAVD